MNTRSFSLKRKLENANSLSPPPPLQTFAKLLVGISRLTQILFIFLQSPASEKLKKISTD